MSLTLEEQAAGYFRLLQAWKRDARHYEAGLKSIRKHAQLNGLPKVAAMVDEIMSFEQQCDICGDHHDGDVPRECATGDSI